MVLDPRNADIGYVPFPAIDEWSALHVDTVRWNRYADPILAARTNDARVLERAVRIAKRAAAVDTGAIEGLYDVDRGFTFTVAIEGATWEAALSQKGTSVRSMIESHFRAYDYVVDFATGNRPISEAWIRQLHAQLCEGQRDFLVQTEIGPQKHPLPLGEYKTLPNHVLTASGEVHSYAPADLTPAEMYRFCEQLRSEAFLNAHPVIQTAYAHYALVAIHPFADGNGRVARALASVFTYKSASVPFLVLVETKKPYFDALAAADKRNYSPFANFVADRCFDAMQLVSESMQAAVLPSVDETRSGLQKLFTTRGGFTHAQVDAAGASLVQLLANELSKATQELQVPNQLTIETAINNASAPSMGPEFRPLVTQNTTGLVVRALTAAPANAAVTRQFVVNVPRDCGLEDDVVVFQPSHDDAFTARITEIVPSPSGLLHMRAAIWVQRVVAGVLQQLESDALKQLNRSGF